MFTKIGAIKPKNPTLVTDWIAEHTDLPTLEINTEKIMSKKTLIAFFIVLFVSISLVVAYGLNQTKAHGNEEVKMEITFEKTNRIEATTTQEVVLSVAPTELSTEIPPTVAPTLLPQESARIKLIEVLTQYGQVDSYYISNEYWQLLANNILQYGAAERILVLEYHGDNYRMYDGAYSMTPTSFEHDMRWLMENNYHFVTGAEMLGFLEGWLDLPKRSIFLTTDSGQTSDKSMGRIVPLYQKLESEYGSRPHMNSFIWTNQMNTGESAKCKNDACWETFRKVRDSGFFTIGTHTESHNDFEKKMNKDETIYDFNASILDIQTNLGLRVYSVTWPFESCSIFPEVIKEAGIKYAFGGWTRETLKLYSYKNDTMLLCLPRLFPPNPDGISGRPNGLTLEEMLIRGEESLPLTK
jgi:hypothetical protein